MPTYQYRCTECATELEAVQKFTDPPLTECPECGSDLRKVFSAVGVVFKGSGFYATDSRAAKKKASASSGAAKDEAKPSTDSSTGGDSASGSKPSSGGDTKPATTTSSSSSGAPAA